MRIGLLGGSFNPAHKGHLYISNEALKKLNLDEIWWLVSPQNPLKSISAPLKIRLDNARAVAKGHNIRVEDLETRFKTNLTSKTLDHIIKRYSGNNFIWLMGADNLAEINQWFNWKNIFNTMPIAVFNRGVYSYSVINSIAGKHYFSKLHKTKGSKSIFKKALPVWQFLHINKNPLSSTMLRMKNNNRQEK
jgi:nicotinate-nucleotide adenylyltransferase